MQPYGAHNRARATGRRARAAAEQLSREGVQIRYVRALDAP